MPTGRTGNGKLSCVKAEGGGQGDRTVLFVEETAPTFFPVAMELVVPTPLPKALVDKLF